MSPGQLPQKFLAEINERADLRRVVELAGGSGARAQDTPQGIKCACPIHRDKLFRNLSLDKTARTFLCANKSCEAAAGGDLISLVALGRGIEYDDAAKLMAAEFRVDLANTVDQKFLTEQVRLGNEHAEAGRLDEAAEVFGHLAALRPHMIEARQGQLRVAEARSDSAAIIKCRETLTTMLVDSGRVAEALEIAKTISADYPDSPVGHRLTGDAHATLGRPDDALDSYMAAADAAEAAGDASAALDAYLRAEEFGSEILDLKPHVERCFETSHRSPEAVKAVENAAERASLRRDFARAATLYSMLTEGLPDADKYRELLLEAAFQAEPWEEWEERAFAVVDRLIARKAYDRVVDSLRELLARQPGNPDCLNRLSAVYRLQGQIAEATAIDVELARRRYDAGEVHEALDDLEAILDGNPGDLTALQALAELESAEGYDFAARETKLRLADALTEANNFEEADRILKELVQSQAEDLGARQRRANVLEKWSLAGNHAAAEEAALELEIVGDSFASATRGRRAMDFYTRAAQLGRPSGELLTKLASAAYRAQDVATVTDAVLRAMTEYQSAGQMDEAVRQGVHFADLVPDSTTLVYQVADMLAASGDVDGALLKLRKLADTHAAAGRREESIGAMEKALGMAAEDPGLLDHLARLYRRFGDDVAAAGILSRAAKVHEDAGRFDAAAKSLQELLAMRSGDVTILERIAEAYEKAAQPEEGLRWQRRLAAAFATAGDRVRESAALERILTAKPEDEEVLKQAAACAAARADRISAATYATRAARLQMAADKPDKAIETIRSAVGDAVPSGETAELLSQANTACNLAKPAAEWARRAAELYSQEGRDADALRVGGLLVRMTPEDTEALEKQLTRLRAAGQADDAVSLLVESAGLVRQGGNAEEAERRLRQAVETDPSSVDAYEKLADLLASRGEAEAAADSLIRAAEEYDIRGDTDEALGAARKALKLHPAAPTARRLMTRVLSEQERTDEAIGELKEIAALLHSQGTHEVAAQTLMDAVELAPADRALRGLLVEYCEAAGDFGTVADQRAYLAEQAEALGELDEAAENLKSALHHAPDRAELRVKRANLLATLGRSEEALQEFQSLGARLAEQRTAAPVLTPTYLPVVKDYDFGSFVVGSTNSFAHATALAVGKAPGKAYNPLFLYSDVGLGKTHLVNAIANHMLASKPDAKILYTGCEDFVAEIIQAIQDNSIAALRQRHKAADMFIVDDVQFLAGKERAQEEFFHLFNALFQAGRQIVVTSDRPPREIARLEKRLLSRFGAGVIVDIGAPDVETRTAILKRENEAAGADISDAVLHYLAENSGSNIRDLKGAFNRVRALRAASTAPLTVDAVRNALGDLYMTPAP